MKLLIVIGGFDPKVWTLHQLREGIMLASKLLSDWVNTTFNPPARQILDRVRFFQRHGSIILG